MLPDYPISKEGTLAKSLSRPDTLPYLVYIVVLYCTFMHCNMHLRRSMDRYIANIPSQKKKKDPSNVSIPGSYWLPGNSGLPTSLVKALAMREQHQPCSPASQL
jgi:hypothetical protein